MMNKIVKSPGKFKQHELSIMNKRIDAINKDITNKCHQLWNIHLFDKQKPNITFNFVYQNINIYLKQSDKYKPNEHKDNKQKWWNNQKASEMSRDFLPSILNATDKMSEYIGKQIMNQLVFDFSRYMMFELLETAITSTFCTNKSGANEVYLRTAFQYARSGLRKKLISYFSLDELMKYDSKSRKNKDIWKMLVKQKKEKLKQIYLNRLSQYQTNNNNNCDTSMNGKYVHKNIVNIPPQIPQYTQITPINNCIHNINNVCYKCVNYSNQITQLIVKNAKLNIELSNIKQINQSYNTDQIHWQQEYDKLLYRYNTLQNQQNSNCVQPMDYQNCAPFPTFQMNN